MSVISNLDGENNIFIILQGLAYLKNFLISVFLPNHCSHPILAICMFSALMCLWLPVIPCCSTNNLEFSPDVQCSQTLIHSESILKPICF